MDSSAVACPPSSPLDSYTGVFGPPLELSSIVIINLKQGRGDSASRAKENGTSKASATPQDM